MKTTQADPLTHLEAVTLDDDNPIQMGVCRAFIASDDGAVKVTTLDGDTVTLTVIGGLVYSIMCTHFWENGTTVTSIVCGN